MSAKKKSKKKKPQQSPKAKKFNITLRESSGDLVQIQISARLRRVPKGFKITRKILAEMIRRKAQTSDGVWTKGGVVNAREGNDPPGIELKIIRWRNPGRKHPKDRAWRTGDQADAWGSLRRVLAKQ